MKTKTLALLLFLLALLLLAILLYLHPHKQAQQHQQQQAHNNTTTNSTAKLEACTQLLNNKFNLSLSTLIANCTSQSTEISLAPLTCNLTFKCSYLIRSLSPSDSSAENKNNNKNKIIRLLYNQNSKHAGKEARGKNGKVEIFIYSPSSNIGKRITIYENGKVEEDYVYLINSSPIDQSNNGNYVRDFKTHYEI